MEGKSRGRVCLVGNGGIALELAHSLPPLLPTPLIWSIKHPFLGNTFFDASTSHFLLPLLSLPSNLDQDQVKDQGGDEKEDEKEEEEEEEGGDRTCGDSWGASLGPGWQKSPSFQSIPKQPQGGGGLEIEFKTEIKSIKYEGEELMGMEEGSYVCNLSSCSAIEVGLSNGRSFECDLLVFYYHSCLFILIFL